MVFLYIFILILTCKLRIQGLVLDFAKRIGYKESRADTINPWVNSASDLRLSNGLT